MKIIGIADKDLILHVTRREFDLMTGMRWASTFYAGQTFNLDDTFDHVPQIVQAKERLASAAQTLRGLASVLDNVDVSIAAKETK